MMPNHFHLAIRVRPTATSTVADVADAHTLPPTGQAFANLFHAYTKPARA
ncbi:MAG: hypothetical protein KatS3mg053_0829 [Candidatus Roseilinea sp.]|nr:MAG: hypothetical protein KatS3mg053_0829 [Candidatus Roseilinea sp.]